MEYSHFFLSLLVMSCDSQASKKSEIQRNSDDPRSERSEGEASLSLKKQKTHNEREEVIQIPMHKVGHVIGKKGWRKNDIVERSGVQALDIKDCQVRITGTDEQRTKAKTIISEIIRVRQMSKTINYFHLLPSFHSAYLPVCKSNCVPFCLRVCLSVGLSACLPSPV